MSQSIGSTKQQTADSNTGYEEYYLSHNILLQAKYICPDGYSIVIHGLCMKLLLIPDDVLKENHTYKLMTASKYNICTDSMSFSKVIANKSQDIRLIHDILEAFFAEGAELFLDHQVTDTEKYVWFAPPLYPTYTPCFKQRWCVRDVNISQSMAVYTCQDGSFIADSLLCFGRDDCKNSEDEMECSVCSHDSSDACFDSCIFPNCQCNMFYYQCQGGGCVHYDRVCDSFVDCPNGDDESTCQRKKEFINFSGTLIKKSYFTGLCDPPVGDMLMCRTKPQCYNSSVICRYDHSGGVMAHCEDGSHLGTGSLCRHTECPRHYKCHGSYCIPSRKVCDRVIDCPTGADEANCVDYSCPGHMRCWGKTYCVPPHEICDGIAHCPQQEDEKHCQICPSGCQCKGTAIYCLDTKNLTLSGDFNSPSAIILHNSYDVFLKFYDQYSSKMEHVWLLDLSNGSFSFLQNSMYLSQKFLSMKILYLNHQKLRTLPPYFINGQSMTYVNLSYNIIHTVHKHAFILMRKIRILILTSNQLQTLESHFSSDLKVLSYLYLSDNPLIHVASNVFQQNPGLMLVRSGWYMVCCVALHVEDCQPQTQFVSSCSYLIASTVQKVMIVLQGIIVIIGNVGALFVQFALIHGNTAEKYLIISLTIADLTMGLYLIAIAYVDLTYSAVFHKIVSEWTNGIACVLIGLLNFVSSEVSLVILSLLSFIRMISIEKVGGMASMKSKIHAACICAWSAIVMIGITYAVLVCIHNIGLRNNMCILLGLSHQRFIMGFERVFQVFFICLNVLLLTVLSISMFCIARLVIKSHKSIRKVSGQQSSKSQEVRLRRVCLKLSLLVVCNVFTWLPFLTVSILLLCGVGVHENILQWVIVLGIPLCASTDPILYNMATLKSCINNKSSKNTATLTGRKTLTKT